MGSITTMAATLFQPSLTELEFQLQKAALFNNEKAFFSLLETLKRMYKGYIPKEKVLRLFHNQEVSLIASLIATTEQITTQKPDDESPKAKIIFEILNVLKDADITIDDLNEVQNMYVVHPQTIGATNAPKITIQPKDEQLYTIYPPFDSFHEWAINNNAGKILNHALVQQAMYIDQIQNLYAKGDLHSARDLYNNSKEYLHLTEAKVFNQRLVQKILYQPSNNENLNQSSLQGNTLSIHFQDKLIEHLLEMNQLSLFKIKRAGAPVANLYKTLKENSDFVRSQQTAVFKIYDVILDFNQEHTKSKITVVQLFDMLKDYFNAVSDNDKRIMLSSDLLAFILENWSKKGYDNERLRKDRKDIVKFLLDKDAQMMPITSHYHALIAMDAGNSVFFAYPGVTETFELFAESIATVSAVGSTEQKSILDQALVCVNNAPHPQPIPDPIIVKALCKHSSSPCYLAHELVYKFALLDPNYYPPLDSKALQALIQSLRYLLEYDVIIDIDSIQPGSHILPFNDPKTNAPYDLYMFIMGDKQLQAGYLMGIRNEELLVNYPIIREILLNDPRAKEELDKSEKRMRTTAQGENVYSFTTIRDFLKNHPDVAVTIMRHIDPAERISGATRVITAAKLKEISIKSETAITSETKTQKS